MKDMSSYCSSFGRWWACTASSTASGWRPNSTATGFGSAEWNLLQRLGLDSSGIAALEPRSCRTRFMHELRAGSAYHIVSGVLDADPGTARLFLKDVTPASVAATFSTGVYIPELTFIGAVTCQKAVLK